MKTPQTTKSPNRTGSESSDDPAQVFAVLTEIHMLHQLSSAGFNKAQDHELHMSHFSILNRLLRFGDGKTPQSLASHMNVTRATMTNSLARLSDAGLIEVRDNPEDKRSKLVFLTPDGRQARDSAIGRVAPLMMTYAEFMKPGEIGTLLKLLRRLHEAMDPEFESDRAY